MPNESLKARIPDPAHVIAFEPEELGAVLFEILRTGGSNKFTLYGTVYELSGAYADGTVPANVRHQIEGAIGEAWCWLEREGILVPDPRENDRLWFVISRRARELQNAADVEAYRQAGLLPKSRLHASIADKVFPAFMRGDYETAVFQAFKEVEVAVRDAGGFDATDLGTDLMRQAFHATNGPLTDPKLPKAEREALAHLFAGAIGRYKNPHSHRNEPLDDPVETAEIILFASHLLRIVQAAKERSMSGTGTT